MRALTPLLAAVVPFLFLLMIIPSASPFLLPAGGPHRRHARQAVRPTRRPTVKASAAASAASFLPDFNVELLRASLRLLGTHERQRAQDYEEALVDAGRELALAKLMAQVCDTRLALLDFVEEHIRRDHGFNGPSTTVWGWYARTEEGRKWMGEFERVGVFKEMPIEVLEEEGLAGVLEDAVAAAAEEEEAEEDSWVEEAWEIASKTVKEEAEKKTAEVKKAVGGWTGPEEWERTVSGKEGKGREEVVVDEEWEMGERAADPKAQTVPEGWEMGESVEGESDEGSQSGWEVEGGAGEGGKEAKDGWLD